MDQPRPTTPPPAIPQPPPRMPDTGSFSRQAALASVLAPAIAVGVTMMTSSPTQGSAVGKLIAGLTGTVLIVAGLVLAILALVGVRQHGRKGILGRSIAGLLINAVLLVSGTFAFQHARAVATKNGQLAREQQGKRIEQEGVDSFLNYSGWYGIAEVGETVLVVTSLADESPSAKMLNSDRTMNVSIAHVSVINRSVSNSVMIDSAKAELALADGRSAQCLPLAEVLGSSKKDADKMIANLLGPHTVRPQSNLFTVFIHMPFGFSWGDVTSVTIHVDGKPVMIQGRVLTASEKADVVEAGRKAQEQQVDQPANTPSQGMPRPARQP